MGFFFSLFFIIYFTNFFTFSSCYSSKPFPFLSVRSFSIFPLELFFFFSTPPLVYTNSGVFSFSSSLDFSVIANYELFLLLFVFLLQDVFFLLFVVVKVSFFFSRYLFFFILDFFTFPSVLLLDELTKPFSTLFFYEKNHVSRKR